MFQNHMMQLLAFTAMEPPSRFEAERVRDERVKLLGSRLSDQQGATGTALDDAFTIACGSGAVTITRAQRAGKGAQDTETFLRGMTVPKGTRLGE